MFTFSRKKPTLLGIDIGSTAVKLIELSKEGERYHVVGYAVAPLSHEALTDKKTDKVEVAGAAVAAALQQSGSKLKQAAVAVAGSLVITKVIVMPASLQEDELEQQIQLEADQYIPYSLDEVSLDFQVLGTNGKNPQMIDVLLAASRREHVDERVAAVELAGLKVSVVDVDTYALEGAIPLIASQLPERGENKMVVLVDAGANVTNFNVIRNLTTVYSREQGFGGKQLTEEIQRRYGLSYEEADMAKQRGGLPDDYHPDILEPFKQALAQQTVRAFQFFTSATAQRDADCAVLAGGCASLPGIDRAVAGQLGVPTVIANPFSGMSISAKVKRQNLEKDAPAMMIACGLAMRSFD